MKILSFETSCDETSIALIEGKGGFQKPQFKIIKEIVSSQIKIHQPFGGIVPNLAKREHQKNLPFIFKKIFGELKPKKMPIDLLAVTIGPGLSPCLWQGINFSKEISCHYKIPLMGINHLEGHIFSLFLQKKFSFKFPCLALIVSGGHTEIVLIKDWFKYKVIGRTRDDALGEAFDKIGRLLGIDYPAGPEIEKRAKKGKIEYSFPSPMIKQKNFDFSFAGLKTAVFYQYLKEGQKSDNLSEEKINNYCASFQKAAFEVILEKTLKAATCFKTKQLILTGGVSANRTLRKEFEKRIKEKKLKIDFFAPQLKYSTDNATMIGIVAYFRNLKEKAKICPKISAKPDLGL